MNFSENKITFRTSFLLLFFCLLSFKGQAQQTTVQGRITASDDLEGVHIINLNTRFATITNKIGFFEIEVSPGDSLKVSSIAYENKIVHIDQDIIYSKTLTIPLKIDVNMLEDVVVRPFNLTGNLNTDLDNIKGNDGVNAVSLGLPNGGKILPDKPVRELHTARTSAGPVPLDLIINTITGRIKRLKQHIELKNQSKQESQAKKSFEHDFYTSHLKIPEHKIDAFIYFCANDPKFDQLLNKRDALELLEFFQEKSISFKKYQ